MRFFVFWDTWGLPFAFGIGGNTDDWVWSFSVGPFHFVRTRALMKKEGE